MSAAAGPAGIATRLGTAIAGAGVYQAKSDALAEAGRLPDRADEGRIGRRHGPCTRPAASPGELEVERQARRAAARTAARPPGWRRRPASGGDGGRGVGGRRQQPHERRRDSIAGPSRRRAITVTPGNRAAAARAHHRADLVDPAGEEGAGEQACSAATTGAPVAVTRMTGLASPSARPASGNGPLRVRRDARGRRPAARRSGGAEDGELHRRGDVAGVGEEEDDRLRRSSWSRRRARTPSAEGGRRRRRSRSRSGALAVAEPAAATSVRVPPCRERGEHRGDRVGHRRRERRLVERRARRPARPR